MGVPPVEVDHKVAAIRLGLVGIGIRLRESAEQLARLATSRELAAAALINLDEDPELSILLAMQALVTLNAALRGRK